MKKLLVLFRLLTFAVNYKAKTFLLIVLGFLMVGFDVLKPLPIKYIIDNVLADKPLPAWLATLSHNSGAEADKTVLLGILVFTSILLVIGSSAVSYFSTNITTKVCQQLVYDFASVLFDKLQKLSLSFYSKSNIGDLMQRITADTYVIYSIVGGILLPSLLAISSLGAMFYIMVSINLNLALLAFAVVPFFALLLHVFHKPLSTSTTFQYELSGKFWSFVHQSLTSVKTIQAYSTEGVTSERFRALSLQFNEASVASTRIAMVYGVLLGIISGVATAVIVGIGAYKGLSGAITTGDLYLFISYIGALFGPVSSLAGIVAASFTITARAQRVFEILDSQEVMREVPDALELTAVKGRVELKNVFFGYGPEPGQHGEGTLVLNDFNLDVPAGATVAIVGPTGAGKTSMISLLLRFYDPWAGGVYMDGVNIMDVTLKSLRKHVSLVLQDSFLLPVSVADNIAFGNPLATRDEVMTAATAAQAHDFIMRLPDQYDTILTEGGATLSGGEKQRISLARAFFRNTPVLILDEPTSALDVETEAKIFEALSHYSTKRTVFIISHRLSTIRHADMIVCLKEGKIAETGTHEGLLKAGKVYAELLKFQNVA